MNKKSWVGSRTQDLNQLKIIRARLVIAYPIELLKNLNKNLAQAVIEYEKKQSEQ